MLEALPMVKFHVTALTEMSAKLLSHEQHENVIMYPNVKMATLDRLFVECDIFLDINHEGEIVEATRRAFFNNQIIFAFKETIHSKEYIADENVYLSNDYKQLAGRIKSLLDSKDAMDKAVRKQHEQGLAAEKRDYIF